MFNENGSDEITKYKRKLQALKAKLNKLERERLLTKHAIAEHLKVKRCYQDAAVLRLKLQKKIATKEKKQK